MWLGLADIHPNNWEDRNIADWWFMMAGGSSATRKGIASLTLLIYWEIWCERNARVFRSKLAPSSVVLDKVKCEARLWVLAGAKRLGDLMPGE
jgi:hypothetical protein